MDFPADRRVDQLFVEQARRTPDAVALEFEGRRLSYAELDARAEDLRSRIEASGVGPGAVIGIYMQRSVEMLVAALGVMKSNNCYLPLDPHYPPDRLEFMVEDSGAPLVLTQEHLRDSVPSAAPRTMAVDASTPIDLRVPPADADSDGGVQTDELLCYIIYTSGSTGKPKGVQISHRAAVNFLWAMKEVFSPQPEDTVLAVTTFSFDIAVLELYLPLICGARVALVTEQTAQDGLALREKIRDVGATIVQTTPSRWRLIVGAGLSRWDGIKHALCGGEAFPLDLAEQLGPNVGSLWNMYGPTEATVWCSLFKVDPQMPTIPIGHPIGNTQLYILDEEDRITPIGVPGELYVGGEQLAKGYLNRPDLTEERFRWFDDFYGKRVRLYRTGDLCQWRSDGEVEYLSRVDQQVKLRGFRIELGEIEASLNRHPEINNSAVTVRDAGQGDQRLVAFLEASGGEAEITVSEMRALLGEKLPEYMIPSHFVVVEKLPLTPNGKVDRKALPSVDLKDLQLEASGTYVAPRDDLEQQLTQIWGEVLGVKRVGIRDNFLELGGHSLAMVAIATRIRQQLERSIPIPVLASTATIEQLSTVLSGDAEEEPQAADSKVDERANRRVLRRALLAVIGVMVFAFALAWLYGRPLQPKMIKEDLFHSYYASTEQAHQQLLQERAPHVVMLGSSSGVVDFSPVAFERSFNAHRQGDGQQVRAYNLSLLGSPAFVGHIYAKGLRDIYQNARRRPLVALVEYAPQNATREALPTFNQQEIQIAHIASTRTILHAIGHAPDKADKLLYQYALGPVPPTKTTRRFFSRIWQPEAGAAAETAGESDQSKLLFLQFAHGLREQIGFGYWHTGARHRLNARYYEGDWVERHWRKFADRGQVLAATRNLALEHYAVPEMRLVDEEVQHVISQAREMKAVADRVVIVMLPIHPAAKLTAAGKRRLHASIATIRAATGAEVIDLYESHGYGPDDFFDVDHLLPRPARELSEELGRRVALLLHR